MMNKNGIINKINNLQREKQIEINNLQKDIDILKKKQLVLMNNIEENKKEECNCNEYCERLKNVYNKLKNYIGNNSFNKYYCNNIRKSETTLLKINNKYSNYLYNSLLNNELIEFDINNLQEIKSNHNLPISHAVLNINNKNYLDEVFYDYIIKNVSNLQPSDEFKKTEEYKIMACYEMLEDVYKLLRKYYIYKKKYLLELDYIEMFIDNNL